MSRLWSEPVFGPLARTLYQKCGLVFEGGQAHLFRKRVERRAQELGCDDVRSYLLEVLARRGEAEYERLVELLTVNETYFFREEEHFHVLMDEFLPDWRKQKNAPLRVWSCACSTGCEPYTLAILLRDRGFVGHGFPKVEILGTDVNGRVLDEARQGVYGEFALRNTPAHYREKYFRRKGHCYELEATVRKMVTFRKINLLAAGESSPGGAFDAIFCRNVLLYFDLEAKRRVVAALAKALGSGGVLFVGRSESLFNVEAAPPAQNIRGVMVHRKP